jgi:hypothetical protein
MKTAYIVMGMHRSGTSSLAGTLVHLGLAPPKSLMRPADDNPKGFWESEVVANLNDQILAAGGSSWHDWGRLSPMPSSQLQAFRIAITQVIKTEFGGADAIVLKDPRMCRLFSHWDAALRNENYEPVVISPMRAPREVAASLAKRNGISHAHGMRLWLRHVLASEYDTRGQERSFLRWDDLLADWRSTLNAAIGLDSDSLPSERAASVDQFLEPSLKHQVARVEKWPMDAMTSDAWDHFQGLKANADDPDILRRLDSIRARFDAACEVFADIKSPFK